MTSLRAIRGVSGAFADKAGAQGLGDSDAFLAKVKTPKARQELAKALGVDAGAVLEVANRADLARIVGVGDVYSNLLEEAGVDTVKELAARVPDNLLAKLETVNAAKKLAQRLPTAGQVKDWVDQAKKLPKLLEY